MISLEEVSDCTDLAGFLAEVCDEGPPPESNIMKFSSDTRVLLETEHHFIVEMRLEDVPFDPGSHCKDKNGADVYKLPEGMKVWSYNHAHGSSVFVGATHITIEGECDTAEVKMRKGTVITASTNDSLCVYDHEEEEVKSSSPLTSVGMLSPVLHRLPTTGTLGDFETGWMIGAFASDGSIINKYTFAYAKASEMHRLRFSLAVVNYEGKSVKRKTYSEIHTEESNDVVGESIKDHYSSAPECMELFSHCFDKSYYQPHEGRASLYKKLPDLSFLSFDCLLGILNGLLDGDGSLSISHSKKKPQPLASYSTSSKFLVSSIKLLCKMLGIRVSASETHPKEGRLQKHINYTLSFSTVDLVKYIPYIKVIYPEAVEVLNLMRSYEQKDDRDIVPIPKWLIDLCCSRRGPLGDDSGTCSSLSTIKSTRKYPYVARATAQRLIYKLHEKLDVARNSDLLGRLSKWETLVSATDVHWDLVESVLPAGKQRVYDLDVPETKVFAVNGGLVVWDTMSAYVPISPEAVREAQDMFPSNNLYNEATGKVIYKPTLESALGLFKLSRITGDSNQSFNTAAEALKAVQSGKLDVNKTITVAGRKTTPGRVLIASALPQAMQTKWLSADPKQLIDGKGLDTLFEELAKNHKAEFATAANRLKDLGNGSSYGSIAIAHPDHKGPVAIAVAEGKGLKREYIPVPTHSLGLNDFSVDSKTRQKFVSQAEKEIASINKAKISPTERDNKIVAVWSKAMDEMSKEHFTNIEANPTNLALMVQANVKPSKTQYRQMVLAPGILEDAAGKAIPTPVVRSYSEGLDMAGYWTQSHGSRGGTIKKVQEVRDPGYFSKQLMQAAMSAAVVTTNDCNTQRGIMMNVGNRDIHDRVLASDFSARGVSIPRGTILAPDVVTKIRSLDKDANLLVRSTLKCEHEKGVCQKCAGISPSGGEYRLGTNLGVLAAQSLGERSVQLTLKSFHSGGVAGGTGSTVNSFKRVQDLTLLPSKIADSATLAMSGGTIDKIEDDATGAKIWIGNKVHHVGKDRGGALLSKSLVQNHPTGWQPPKVGMKVEAGQILSDPSRTFVNPHDLYKATNNMERVQNFLTDELHGIYKNEGVRRQNVETLVRSMGELTKVRDPGDSSEVLKGEYRNASLVRTMNKELTKAGKKPIEHSPILKGIDVLPLVVQEDFMAKLMHRRLRDTIIEAAAMGGTSDIHSNHPVPSMAYGAEFGLTQKDSLKPRLGHLKGVKDHNY